MVAAPSLAQDATRFSLPEIAWAKPSAQHAASADAAGMAQRVDPSALNTCGNGKVLTLGNAGAFVCTDTVAHASYASISGDANTIGGKTADQLSSANAASERCNIRSIKHWGNDQWVSNGGTYIHDPIGGCQHKRSWYICVSGTWALTNQDLVDDNCN